MSTTRGTTSIRLSAITDAGPRRRRLAPTLCTRQHLHMSVTLAMLVGVSRRGQRGGACRDTPPARRSRSTPSRVDARPGPRSTMHAKKIGTIFVRRAYESAKLRLTRAAGSPYRVLHRSRETSHAMTAAVATPHADPHPASAVARAAAGGARAPAAASPATSAHTRPITPRFVVEAGGWPVHTSHARAMPRAGTA